MSSLAALGVAEAGEAMRAGRASSRAITEACLARVERLDGRLGAFLARTPDLALAQADEADRRRAAGEDGPLLGMPYALKDIFTTRGIATTAASRILEGYLPPDDSAVQASLRAAGAVLLGKLNMDEFAMGSSTEHSAYLPCFNPWDLDRVPGGSSGGSAAAVAADLCAFSLGTDTGGSVRQPAAFCGVVGLKPTYGRVSRRGIIALASSMDQAGPMTKTVADAAAVLGALAGHDPRDATSADRPADDFAAGLERGVDGLRLGLPHAFFGDGLDPAVRALVERSLARLEGAGANLVPIDLPHVHLAIAAYTVLLTAEASANLARYDGLRYGRAVLADDLTERLTGTRAQGFGPEVKRRILLGSYVLSSGYQEAYYGQAGKVRSLIAQDFQAAWSTCDAIVGPTTPTTAFRHGERLDDPLAMYLSDIYTAPANLAGLPALSLPCGLAGGLPVGLQLIGQPWDEALLLRIGRAVEVLRGERARPPEFLAQEA